MCSVSFSLYKEVQKIVMMSIEKKYQNNWNFIDRIFLFFEDFSEEIKNAISELKTKDADSENMISAATQFLSEENERLREREIPHYLKIQDEKYICPSCKRVIDEPDFRWCPSCGLRVMRTSYESNKICEDLVI